MSKTKRDLREWMKQNRYTPASLAREMGLSSRESVWNWILERNRISEENLESLNKVIQKVEKEPFDAKDFFPSDWFE